MGRIGIGRIERGVARANEPVTVCNFNDKKVRTNCKIVNLYQIEGLERVPVESAKAGRRNRRRTIHTPSGQHPFAAQRSEGRRGKTLNRSKRFPCGRRQNKRKKKKRSKAVWTSN